MNVRDAILALLLAAHIHDNADAIRATAQRCAKRLPRRHRYLMFSIMASPDPLTVTDYLAKNLSRCGC